MNLELAGGLATQLPGVVGALRSEGGINVFERASGDRWRPVTEMNPTEIATFRLAVSRWSSSQLVLLLINEIDCRSIRIR